MALKTRPPLLLPAEGPQFRSFRSVLLALLPLLTLVGCGSSSSDVELQRLPPVRRRPPVATPVRPPQPIGLTALPTPQAVVRSLQVGRVDPFAALPASTAAVKPGQPALPSLKDFRFNGVIRSQGSVQALVQVGNQSGPLCVGPRGACPGSGLEALLPAGWTVAAIDAASGCLTLVHGGERQRPCLS